MNEVEQLDALYPGEIGVLVSLGSVRGEGGEPVTFIERPIRVGKLAAFLRAVNDLLPAFESGAVDNKALVMRHSDAIIVGLAVARNTDRELIEELDLADLVVAVTAVVEVNAEFFTQRLLTELDLAAKKKQAARGLTSANA